MAVAAQKLYGAAFLLAYHVILTGGREIRTAAANIIVLLMYPKCD